MKRFLSGLVALGVIVGAAAQLVFSSCTLSRCCSPSLDRRAGGKVVGPGLGLEGPPRPRG